jgi:hypothetical protein
MDLLDRYLAAIGRELPEGQRADITAELRDVLMTRVEEKEAELGRQLEVKDLEALLVDYGHPLSVAGRYRKHQYLIGPEVYPFWCRALKVTLAWIAGVYVVLAVFGILAGGEIAMVTDKVETPIIVALVFAFGVVTLVCALIERYGKGRFLAKWRARDLPPAKGRSVKTFDLVVETGAGAIALLWWIGAIRLRAFIPDWGMQLELAPVWMTVFWPVVVYWMLEISSNLFALAQPSRVLVNGVLRAGRYVLGALILGVVLRDGHYVVVSSDRIPSDVLPVVQANFDRGFNIGIGVSILCMLAYAVYVGWRLRSTLLARRPLGSTSAA